jgi:hypothetical protein
MTRQQKLSTMLQLAAISKMLREDRKTQVETFGDWIEDFQQFQADRDEFKEEK